METIKFEGIKTSLKQTKDGYSLTLAVHPDELPEDLMRDFVGARYVVVMVRLADNETPLNREQSYPGDHAVKMAGMLCRDPQFWAWLFEREWLMDENENACIDWLTSFLHIESRKELKTNEVAREAFNQLRKSFEDWKR